MPPPRSAGIVLFREKGRGTEVLLIRPGGPFWRNKRQGAWMIPKGGIDPGESALEAAVREFEEELGSPLERVPFPLCMIRQAAGKVVEVFAAEGDLDTDTIESGHFEVEWPPRSGERQLFPEVEQAQWMSMEQARAMMLPSQLPILDSLEDELRSGKSR